jgi:hypothetical protein
MTRPGLVGFWRRQESPYAKAFIVAGVGALLVGGIIGLTPALRHAVWQEVLKLNPQVFLILLSLVGSALIGSRISAIWNLRQKQKELDLANSQSGNCGDTLTAMSTSGLRRPKASIEPNSCGAPVTLKESSNQPLFDCRANESSDMKTSKRLVNSVSCFSNCERPFSPIRTSIGVRRSILNTSLSRRSPHALHY